MNSPSLIGEGVTDLQGNKGRGEANVVKLQLGGIKRDYMPIFDFHRRCLVKAMPVNTSLR